MVTEYSHIDYEVAVKYLAGEMSQAEQSAFELYIDSDPSIKKEFESIRKIWSVYNQKERYDENKAWNNIQSKLELPKQTSKKRYLKLYLASSIAACGLVLFLLFFFKNSSNNEQITLAANTEIFKNKMSDSSTITLNRNAIISYSKGFGSKNRTLKLKGEAYFEVSKNKELPFIINTENGSFVRVVGTKFNVYCDSSITKVSVVEGIVEVHSKSGQDIKRLTKGNSIIYNALTDKFIQVKQELNDIHYVTNNFVFENTNLKEVFRTLGKTYKMNIVVKDSSIYNFPITTVFNNKNINDICFIISSTFDFEYKIAENTITFDTKKANNHSN